ncbi:MAG: DNA mismatch repair endonuclease MutL [Lachnospiraceae bacterium]|nr:DNA mismatch repair endonuclease MutL [Lachnospiraceae bacterium]
MIINVLNQDTINKIAAGEVIERPSAVIKETVENSIDAKANQLTVETKDGGTTFIRITDNGSGIEKDDIPLAFKSHATSKIKDAKDLLAVSSFGFRGEALSSIAAVSKVELITKKAADFTGYRYVIEGGVSEELLPVGCPDGSTFIIRDLFYNTPARLKFLKSAQTESGYIQEILEKIAISHPEITFKYIADGKVKLQTPGNGKQKDAIYYIFGREIASNLFPVEFDENGIKITGFIGKPVVTRGNRNYENYYVNGRFIKNNVISKAIEEAYKPFIMLHRYPFTSLMIEVDPEAVDVNVHPQKAEVRFSDGETIYLAVYHAVTKALRSEELIPDVSVGKEEKPAPKPVMPDIPVNKLKVKEEQPAYKAESFNPAPVQSPAQTTAAEVLPEAVKKAEQESVQIAETAPVAASVPASEPATSSASSPATEPSQMQSPSPAPEAMPSSDTETIATQAPVKPAEKPMQLNFISEEAKENVKIIGQLFDTYWLFSLGDTFYMMDQHAAHEKVMYEQFVKAFNENTANTQRLMPPIIVSLSEREKNALAALKDYLAKCGFEIDAFGGHEYAISGVPTETYTMDPKEMLTAILDEYVDSERATTPKEVYEKIASMSCKAAVKGNNTLSMDEARKLFDKLLTLDNPYNCPHGRPTVIRMSKYEIEKKFKRIV